MTILKFQPTKECAFLRINIALDVQERMERYRILCGGLDLTGLVEHTLVNVVRPRTVGAREGGAATPAKGEQRWRFGWVSPADKTSGAP